MPKISGRVHNLIFLSWKLIWLIFWVLLLLKYTVRVFLRHMHDTLFCLIFKISLFFSSSTSYSRSGNVYSQGWPAGYSRSYSTCNTRLAPGSNVGTKVAIMDIDLNNNGYYYCSSLDDYVSVEGKCLFIFELKLSKKKLEYQLNLLHCSLT